MAEAKMTSAKKKTKKADVDAVTKEEVTEVTEAVEKPTKTKATAKAGKRSEKVLKEVEAKQAKEERKTLAPDDASSEKPKKLAKPARSKLERRSKGYRKVSEMRDANKSYPLKEALDLAVKTSPTKFDATVELHINLGVDPKQADQNIRQMVVLPAGTGKTVRVAVFADNDDISKAKKAGADIAAGEEFLQQLDKGTLDFDILISTPTMMAKLGKYARVLGPKGLMPNPKSGTVTANVAKAVTEAKAGRVEFRVDSTGIVHVGIGKVSFGKEKLAQNAQAILDSVKAAKPASVKGVYLKSTYVTTSMGPSIKLENN